MSKKQEEPRYIPPPTPQPRVQEMLEAELWRCDRNLMVLDMLVIPDDPIPYRGPVMESDEMRLKHELIRAVTRTRNDALGRLHDRRWAR